MASEPASGLRRRADIFLDRILLAHDGHRPWLVRSSVLHGNLSCDLGMVLRPCAATTKNKPRNREQMGSDAGPGSEFRSLGATAMDKFDKQPATRPLCSQRRGQRLNGCAVGFSPALVGTALVSRYTTVGH